MGTIDDIMALLADARAAIGEAEHLHHAALTDASLRPAFRTKVKTILEHQRSALDYLAVGITHRYGSPKGNIYYPLAQGSADFAAQMKLKMPGVETAAPTVAAAIRSFQPDQPGCEWIRELNQLAREQKHNRLTLQILRDTFRCKVTEDATGCTVEWHGLRFENGRIDSQGGTITFNAPDRPKTLPEPFSVTTPNVFGTPVVFGVPIDPLTQRPIPDARLTVEQQREERWFFTSPHIPVLTSLERFQDGTLSAITEINKVALL